MVCFIMKAGWCQSHSTLRLPTCCECLLALSNPCWTLPVGCSLVHRGRIESTINLYLSRTHKLLTQIKDVCQVIRDMRVYSSVMRSHSPLSAGHKNRGPLPGKCGKGERGCTHSTSNKKHARCEDLCNNLCTQKHHGTPSPPLTLPPSFPSPTSSHSSSEVSASGPSTSSDEPPSCLTGDNVGETMALSSSQKETKESLEEQDSRGGGLTRPDKTSEWRSLNKAGIGDCLKSPKMGHWQHAEGVEL